LFQQRIEFHIPIMYRAKVHKNPGKVRSMMRTPLLQATLNMLMGQPGGQRVRASQTLLSVLFFVLFAVVQHTEVVFGLIDPTDSWRLTAFNLSGALLFYAVIRSGLNLKLSAEPSLTMPQMVFGLCALTWSYAITGPARGAVMSIMMLILFYGMFALQPKQARQLALLGFGLLTGAMAYNAWFHPQRYDPHVEWVHLVFAAIVTGGVAVLASRFGRMRQRLSAQKAELGVALARIQALASRDALTGLLNRRAMLEQLERHSSMQARDGAPMCLCLFDLDHFKRVNDKLGHAMGDQVLKAFASVAQAEVRSGDIFSRWGGEEFLLLMPDTGIDVAWHCVERIRHALSATRCDLIPPGLRVTFSAGLAACQASDAVEAAIDRADKAMYKAKAAGRNRTERADPV
jgi:diguanylate cyclase (GGDEF)-like protein